MLKVFEELIESKPPTRQRRSTKDVETNVFLKDDSSEEDVPGTKKEEVSNEEELTPYQKAGLKEIQELLAEGLTKPALKAAAPATPKRLPRAESVEESSSILQTVLDFFNTQPSPAPAFEGTTPSKSVN